MFTPGIALVDPALYSTECQSFSKNFLCIKSRTRRVSPCKGSIASCFNYDLFNYCERLCNGTQLQQTPAYVIACFGNFQFTRKGWGFVGKLDNEGEDELPVAM